jgi:uncharacterized membrane protein
MHDAGIPPTVRAHAVELAPTPAPCSMELWISYVLRAGVTASAAVIGLGLVLLLLQGPAGGEPTSIAQLHKADRTLATVTPGATLEGITHFRANALIEMGVLLLILTPTARVAMTAILFALQRDRTFVLITSIVLAMLVLGLLRIGA